MAERNTLTDEQAAAFVANLKRFREELSEALGEEVTQETLADIAGLKIDTLRSYEAGKKRPSAVPLMKLATVFRRRVEDLISLDPGPPESEPPAFIAWYKKIGTPPPGWDETASKLFREVRPEAAAARAALKRQMLKGKVQPGPRPRK